MSAEWRRLAETRSAKLALPATMALQVSGGGAVSTDDGQQTSPSFRGRKI